MQRNNSQENYLDEIAIVERVGRSLLQQIELEIDLLISGEIFLRNLVEADQALTPERIQQFSQFLADESLAGNQCGVCLDVIEVGRRMMRLDCTGQHVFCQPCIEKWFADHNTCPNCRHEF